MSDKRRTYCATVGLAAVMLLARAPWLWAEPPVATPPDVCEQALRAIERLSQAEQIEDSYFDVAVTADRIYRPHLDKRALQKQIAEMAEKAKTAWDAAGTPDDKVDALSKVVFGNYGFSAHKAP